MTVSVDLSEARRFKSSYSESYSQCAEVSWLNDGRVGVRDSKDPPAPC